MALISIEEQQGGEVTRWRATLSFNHGPKHPITVCNAFSPEQEQELEWYFEEHLCFPFTNKVKAQRAAASIQSYGEALFDQVFADRKAYATYQGCVQAGLPTVQIEISGSPAFHSLHWEALKDPDLSQPLALQATMVRKNLTPSPVEATVRPSPTINLLVVTARPSGKQDVGYRTISRPIVEALRQAGVPVQIEILRPGTYEALDQYLRDVSVQKGVGYYHVIHFDVHGALLSYDAFQQERQVNRYLYQERYGRPDLEPYEGEEAFLFLEGTQEHKADPVEARELAALLLSHQVPIAILNACQSGKQIGSSETSLGSRLMQAGVQLVLAMGYSVTVSAAALMMRTLYRQLFANQDLATAICFARQELYNRKERQAYFNQTIDLEDWLLPVVYQNQSQRLTVRDFTSEESAAYYGRQAARYAPPQPSYGFVGRDVDILEIEKRLLTRRNLLLVQGMGGAGKTTLLRHLGNWWQTTGFVEQVFSFGYDEQAWTHQQLLVSIAQQLLDPVQYVRDFQPLSLDAQQPLLMHRLRGERHLLILDNLESITGAYLAIQHTLPPEEQTALCRFLVDLVGGRTLVVLGSRGGEAWLAKETFDNNVYDLSGLDPEAASLLTDRILEGHGATRYRQDSDLLKLLKLLGGFPLALEAVLVNLARETPTEVLAALQAGNMSLDKGDSQDKTESILRCIDYSHSNLSSEAQQLLICLAPFTSVLFLNLLDKYTTHLRKQSVVAKLPFDRWPEVLQEARNWGLLSADPDIPGFLRLQPTLPYFLRSRLNAPEQAEVKDAVETAFRLLYDQFGATLFELFDSKEPQERQLGQVLTSLEYENLASALNLALAAQTSIHNPYFALSRYLDTTQDHRRGLQLGQTVLDSLETYPTSKLSGRLGFELAHVIGDIALRQARLKQYTEAETSFQKILTLAPQLEELDEEQRGKLKATTYHNLGNVAAQQRQWDKARDLSIQALEIFVTHEDNHSASIVLRSLARVWQASGDAKVPVAVAAIIGVTPKEAEELFRERGEEEHGEGGR